MKLSRYFTLYKEGFRIAFSSASAYRTNFVLSTLMLFLGNFFFPLATILIYNSGSSFPGWDFYQVLLIQSIFTISLGFSSMLFSGFFWTTNYHIKEGTLEIILIRPVDTLFFLMTTTINLQGIGMVAGGIVMSAFALSHVGVITFSGVIQSIIFFVCGLLVMCSVNMIMAATSFKWVGNSRIPEIFDSFLAFGKYPITIFPSIIQSVFSFIVPAFLVSFYPAASLLGQTSFKDLLVCLPCFVFLIFGVLLFKHMVRLYEGVGG